MSIARVAIVGGGPGGLLTVRQLQALAGSSCRITIYEATNRLGGKIQTKMFKSAPVHYEAGAAELYDYSATGVDPLSDLIRHAGLERRTLRGTAVVMNDVLLKSEKDIEDCFGIETCKALRNFQREAKSLISPADYYESDWRADNSDPLSKQTLAQLLERVPDCNARQYILTALHSDLATEAHRTSAMYGLQNYLMNEPGYMSLYTIAGGIEKLIDELIRSCNAEMRLNQPVERIEKGIGNTYRVVSRTNEHSGTSPMVEEFDYVVVALPNSLLPAIQYADQKLSQAIRRHYIHYDYPAHYLRVSVLFEKPFWREYMNDSYFMSDAFGGCCIYDESSRIDDCTYGVLGWLLAGDAALSMGNLDDQTLIDRVIHSLPSWLPEAKALKMEGHVHRWAGAVNGMPGGFPVRDPDARHVPEPEENPKFFVVGDYLFDSTLNGVMDSADTVAQWIDELIRE